MASKESLDIHIDERPQADDTNETWRQFHYFIAPEVGAKALKAASAAPGVDKNIDNFLNSARQRVIDRFPSNLEGINIERINDFFDGLSLETPPLIVLDREQEAEFEQAVAEAKGFRGDSRQLNEVGGWFNGDLDLAVVFRDSSTEFLNGPEYTESLIVHELAHGSGLQPDIRVEAPREKEEKLAVHHTRVGQSVSRTTSDEKVGGFLEEAFAEQLRAKYVTDVLGKKNGLFRLADRAEGTVSYQYRAGRKRIKANIPSKYAYFDLAAPSLAGIHPASFAGAAIDELSAKDPELLPAMIKARGDVHGLREVAQRINAIKPGLYRELRDDFNSADEYDNGYLHALEATRGEKKTRSTKLRRKIGAWFIRRNQNAA